MLCPVHKVEMREQPQKTGVYTKVPLHRCPICTAEYRVELQRARDNPSRRLRPRRQLTSPTHPNWERWL